MEIRNTKKGHTFILRFHNTNAGRLAAKSRILDWYRNRFLREQVGFNEYAVESWYDSIDALEWDDVIANRFKFPQGGKK